MSDYRGTGVEHPPAVFEYRGVQYPTFIREGNAQRFAAPFAGHFCRGVGLDVGCGQWPFSGSQAIDASRGDDAMNLPAGLWDYVFSSHCLEHLPNPVAALEHWLTRVRSGGTLFLYLPHPDMIYWRPQHCRKHLHLFYPADTASMLRDLGLVNVIHSERDLAWSFAVTGNKP